MVLGHTACPWFIHDFIYLFHMPLFFVLSGYFFHEITEIKDLKDYYIRKIKGLWKPYVKWSLFFLFIHNSLVGLGWHNSEYYSAEILTKKAIQCFFTLTGQEPELGGFWFVQILFYSLVLMAVISYISHKMDIGILPQSIILFFFAVLFLNLVPNIKSIFGMFFGTFFIVMGMFWRKFESSAFKEKNIWIVALLPILLMCTMFKYSTEFLLVNSTSIFSFTVISLLGCSFFLIVSKVIELKTYYVKRCLIWIGNRTMTILALHFSAFHLLNVIYCSIFPSHIDMLYIYQIPGLWPIYFIIGLVVPLLFSHFYDVAFCYITQKVRKRKTKGY